MCSRTSCGGSLWKPKHEASGVGECPSPPPFPSPRDLPHLHLSWGLRKCRGKGSEYMERSTGENMEVGCERGQPRPGLWLKQLGPHSQQISGNTGIARALIPSPVSCHTTISLSLLFWEEAGSWKPRHCLGQDAILGVGVGVGSLLRAFIQRRIPGEAR